jgi:hypothetical protein
MRILLIPLLLTACTASAPNSASNSSELARLLDGRVVGEPKSCVPMQQQDGLRAIDENTFVVERGRTLWVNRLPSACPGIRPFSTLIVRVHTGQYCQGDRVQALEPGASIPGPYCILGDFVPYQRASSR